MSEVQSLNSTLGRGFSVPAEDPRVMRTAAALEAHGITVVRVANAVEAKHIVLELIPAGSQVHHGASRSLEASGIAEEIERSGRYGSIRSQAFGMNRKTQADEIRRLTASPDVMLGSVHAVTETGSLVTASASGSQLGPYASAPGRSSSWSGRRRSCPISREHCNVSTNTPSRSRTRVPRLHTAFTAA
jgi:hypothetical protein